MPQKQTKPRRHSAPKMFYDSSKSGICSPRRSTIVFPLTTASPIFSPKLNTRPPSTWKIRNRFSSLSPWLLRFVTCRFFAATSRTRPTLQSYKRVSTAPPPLIRRAETHLGIPKRALRDLGRGSPCLGLNIQIDPLFHRHLLVPLRLPLHLHHRRNPITPLLLERRKHPSTRRLCPHARLRAPRPEPIQRIARLFLRRGGNRRRGRLAVVSIL